MVSKPPCRVHCVKWKIITISLTYTFGLFKYRINFVDSILHTHRIESSAIITFPHLDFVSQTLQNLQNIHLTIAFNKVTYFLSKDENILSISCFELLRKQELGSGNDATFFNEQNALKLFG